MDPSTLLWIDLRSEQDKPALSRYLDGAWSVHCTDESDQISREIMDVSPALLCFEYDYPDISGLLALQQTVRLFPSMPSIMLTEQHSEALAVWALRNRIWDYLVKPLTPLDLRRSVENSLSMRYGGQYGQRDNPIPPDLRFYKLHRKVTLPAEYFVENHYHEKIYEEHVAQLCGMKTCVFSRAFKKEHGTTFRRYLLEYRISKARELLRRPEVLVRDIAYTVGFRDPSYFTRIFRRIVGVSPLRYHERHAECEGNRKNLHHRDHHSGGYPNR